MSDDGVNKVSERDARESTVATSSEQETDRRTRQRQELAAFAWYQLLDEAGSPQAAGDGVAHAGDISQTGVRLYTSRPLPEQRLAFVEVSAGELQVSGIGVIRHTSPAAGGNYRSGIAFVVLPPNARIALRKYCRNE